MDRGKKNQDVSVELYEDDIESEVGVNEHEHDDNDPNGVNINEIPQLDLDFEAIHREDKSTESALAYGLKKEETKTKVLVKPAVKKTKDENVIQEELARSASDATHAQLAKTEKVVKRPIGRPKVIKQTTRRVENVKKQVWEMPYMTHYFTILH